VFFEAQILPIEVPQKKGPHRHQVRRISARRHFARSAREVEAAFKKDGTVTAGNAPGTNDGAAALIVTSERNAARLGKQPIARIVAQAVSGIEPKWVMMAPVEAVEKLLAKIGWIAIKTSTSLNSTKLSRLRPSPSRASSSSIPKK